MSDLNTISTTALCTALGLTLDQLKKSVVKHLPSPKRAGLGGKNHWTIHTLPVKVSINRGKKVLAVRKAAMDYQLAASLRASAPENQLVPSAPARPLTKPPAIRAPISAEQADAEQVICQQARLCILTAVRKSVADGRSASESAAYDSWLALLASGELAPQQVLWSALANDKNGFRYEVSYASGTPVAIALDGHEKGRLSFKSSMK